MRANRLFLDRLLRPVAPRPDLGFTPAPRELASGIWAIDRRLRVAGAILPTRSTVVEIGFGSLAVISPPADPCSDLDLLGTVAAVIAPNSFHYLFAKRFAAQHPSARLFVAPGLCERVPSLTDAFELTPDAGPPWAQELEFAVLGPSRGISEVFFLHHASQTLILTDVAFNLVDLARRYDRLAWRAFGVPPHFGPSRNARKLLLQDRTNARELLRTVAQWPFERIVVAHGDLVDSNAREAFETAFSAYL